jgi:hypothetical protein
MAFVGNLDVNFLVYFFRLCFIYHLIRFNGYFILFFITTYGDKSLENKIDNMVIFIHCDHIILN